MHRGFLKIWRKIEEWEWYGDPNVLVMFIHLLLKANLEDKKWKGQTIKRGQLVTGRKSLSKQTGLSEQEVRTALNKLRATSNLTITSTNKYSLITLNNYEHYNDGATSKSTSKSPTSNQQSTTTKEDKKIRNKYIGEYEGWLETYNSEYGTKYKTKALLKNYSYWRKVYSESDMLEAISKIKNHDWLFDKTKPELILRQRDRGGNPVDRIGELLSIKGKKHL